MAALGLAGEERFVDQCAAGRQRVEDVREERPVQVARDDDQVEPRLAEIDARRFKIHVLNPNVELEPNGLPAQPIEGAGITIDSGDGKTRCRKQQRMPAFSAGHVEHASRVGQQIDVVNQPRRWPGRLRLVKRAWTAPLRHPIRQLVDSREPRLCQQPRDEPAADGVLAAHEQRLVQVVEHGRSAGRQVDGEQACPGDVPKRRELVRRADVEHGGAGLYERGRVNVGDAPDLVIESRIEMHACLRYRGPQGPASHPVPN